MDERWMPVVGYEEWYEVSDAGRVRTRGRSGTYPGRWGPTTMNFPARDMALSKTRAGYRYVCLKKPNEPGVKHLVHRIVMRAFCGESSAEQPQVNHKDGDKGNNTLSNLEYCSCSENLRHCIDTLGKKRGRGAGNARLTEEKVMAIRRDSRILREVAADYGVSLQTISKVRNGTAWSHVPTAETNNERTA